MLYAITSVLSSSISNLFTFFISFFCNSYLSRVKISSVPISSMFSHVVLIAPIFKNISSMLSQLPKCHAIYINPDSFMELSVEDKTYVISHEVLHVAFNHHNRMGMRNQMKWNIAPGVGFEPTRPCGHRLSRPTPLSIRASRRLFCGPAGIRTRVSGWTGRNAGPLHHRSISKFEKLEMYSTISLSKELCILRSPPP